MTAAAEIEAARLLLERLGFTPEQLLQAAAATAPTVGQYIAAITASMPQSTLRVYGTYLRRIEDAWGERVLTEPTAAELRQLAEQAKHNAVIRRNSRGGRSAAESLIAAARYLYRRAEEDRYIRPDNNPARRVAKPRRLASTRRAISHNKLAEIVHVAATTGKCPHVGPDRSAVRRHSPSAVEIRLESFGGQASNPGPLVTSRTKAVVSPGANSSRWYRSPASTRHRVNAHNRHRVRW
ncbi:hypothetical protein DFR70_11180 [Nocardia tenerifensis]|uniref:Core-binding (CB) domain-containing protein n=1 Tax=Nocardia tenerifensis TaxID=228006 RepID=A0A318K7C5_9NOCA|nr:hypothetical protein DFR70_11180 [Nocardia tenerifensis]